MRRSTLPLAWLVACGVVACLLPNPAHGIPAFARKYRMSCTTCHAPFPRLTSFGEDFAARGFRLEDATQEPARATVDTGDPLLQLPREFPIAVRLEGAASWKEDADAENDLEWPWVWKILSGGPIGKHVSYYFYFLIEKGEVEGVEDAYLQFCQLGGLPLDIVVGQFQVSDPLFKRELRLMRDDYQIYTTRVGESNLNLAYDRGIVLGWGAPAGFDVILELVNGNGIPHADEAGNFDDDAYKNPALRLAWSGGGVRLGAFGYYGKQEDATGVQNETYYYGPDVALAWRQWAQLNLQYLERRDNDPFFVGQNDADLVTRGGFAELHVFPQGHDGRWALTALYNRVESDDLSAEAEAVSLTANWLLHRNVRLYLDGSRDLQVERSRVSLGVAAAF